ncbi:hypothetical protein [Methylomicrobium sp. Wu6]|nr:hypothetical protein [Methylomicrobium sp. Wu6]MEC4750614.1 hypothetical protein [Methylomicrobium sp. Wu6]
MTSKVAESQDIAPHSCHCHAAIDPRFGASYGAPNRSYFTED